MDARQGKEHVLQARVEAMVQQNHKWKQRLQFMQNQINKLRQEILGDERANSRSVKPKQKLPKYVFDYHATLKAGAAPTHDKPGIEIRFNVFTENHDKSIGMENRLEPETDLQNLEQPAAQKFTSLTVSDFERVEVQPKKNLEVESSVSTLLSKREIQEENYDEYVDGPEVKGDDEPKHQRSVEEKAKVNFGVALENVGLRYDDDGTVPNETECLFVNRALDATTNQRIDSLVHGESEPQSEEYKTLAIEQSMHAISTSMVANMSNKGNLNQVTNGIKVDIYEDKEGESTCIIGNGIQQGQIVNKNSMQLWKSIEAMNMVNFPFSPRFRLRLRTTRYQPQIPPEPPPNMIVQV
ncbi:hypothetical protein HanIR_Chr14g0691821 [Helianthus annuus]|nr:hypothetical protein HanIR_Chr14g0691821 [Helianthus annuus]